MKLSKKDCITKLQSFYETLGSEMDTCYKDLDLIKNAGVAIAILTAIFAYVGYSISSNAILGFATFSFFVFVVLFTVFNFFAIKIAKPNKTVRTNPQKIDTKALLRIFTEDSIVSQIIMPLLSLLTVIYLGLFLLHVVGIAYSGSYLRYDTIFAISSSKIVNFIYALSVLTSIIAVIASLRNDNRIKFFGYGAAVTLIEITSFAFVIHNLLISYPSWLSYQLWLAVIIEFLLYFALIQYKYAINAKLKIVKYKNGLSIIKAKAEQLIDSIPKGKLTKVFYKNYNALKIEYDKLEKPKLVVSDAVPILLLGYVTLDVSKELLYKQPESEA